MNTYSARYRAAAPCKHVFTVLKLYYSLCLFSLSAVWYNLIFMHECPKNHFLFLFTKNINNSLSLSDAECMLFNRAFCGRYFLVLVMLIETIILNYHNIE